HTTFGPTPPAVPTFPSGLPVLALDRIMGNRHGLVSGVEAHDTPLSRVASDHLPLTAFVHL
ncbi:MAG: EEP domain-containing protein, partial [Mesorhizobium sp.]